MSDLPFSKIIRSISLRTFITSTERSKPNLSSIWLLNPFENDLIPDPEEIRPVQL